MQKKCSCPETPEAMDLSCCKSGWNLIMVGSRYCSDAETRYAPVEGEALGVHFALEKCKYFTYGIPGDELYIFVDHRPLLGLLCEDKQLADVTNNRLRNLCAKSAAFGAFHIKHVPGLKNFIPDAGSRFPAEEEGEKEGRSMHPMMRAMKMLASRPLRGWEDHYNSVEDYVMEQAVGSLAQFNAMTQRACRAITPNRVRVAGRQCPEYSALAAALSQREEVWPASLAHLEKLRPRLDMAEDFVVFEGRTYIPESLREDALRNLHVGHQSCGSRIARASETLYWPGITADIRRFREECQVCNTNAPSQPKEPPVPLTEPDYPWQQLAMDFADIHGRHYLVVVDRFSGWLEVAEPKPGSGGIINSLMKMFTTLGWPKEITSDGDAVFTSHQFQDFLDEWGIKHRVASAYNPHSNQRAEAAVKSAKRILRDALDGRGNLTDPKVVQALVEHRNTKDRDLKLSPAEMMMARTLQGGLPEKECNLRQNPDNIISAEERARRLQPRQEKRGKQLQVGTATLSPLADGDVVQIQNQQSKKWDKTGTVVSRMEGGHSYQILEDGSGSNKYSMRNRVHLRRLHQQKVEPEKEKSQGPKVPMPCFMKEFGEEGDTGVIHLGTIPKYPPKMKVQRTAAIQKLLDQTFDPSLKTGAALQELSQSKLASTTNPLRQVTKALLKEKTDEIGGKLDTMAGDGRMSAMTEDGATYYTNSYLGLDYLHRILKGEQVAFPVDSRALKRMRALVLKLTVREITMAFMATNKVREMAFVSNRLKSSRGRARHQPVRRGLSTWNAYELEGLSVAQADLVEEVRMVINSPAQAPPSKPSMERDFQSRYIKVLTDKPDMEERQQSWASEVEEEALLEELRSEERSLRKANAEQARADRANIAAAVVQSVQPVNPVKVTSDIARLHKVMAEGESPSSLRQQLLDEVLEEEEQERAATPEAAQSAEVSPTGSPAGDRRGGTQSMQDCRQSRLTSKAAAAAKVALEDQEEEGPRRSPRHLGRRLNYKV